MSKNPGQAESKLCFAPALHQQLISRDSIPPNRCIPTAATEHPSHS
jgi:hypothetical protein